MSSSRPPLGRQWFVPRDRKWNWDSRPVMWLAPTSPGHWRSGPGQRDQSNHFILLPQILTTAFPTLLCNLSSSISAHATNNPTGSFRSVLPGLFHQKNYVKASLLSPHMTETIPQMLSIVTRAVLPHATGAPIHSLTDISPVIPPIPQTRVLYFRVHPAPTCETKRYAQANRCIRTLGQQWWKHTRAHLLITNGKGGEWVQTVGYFLSGYVPNWRCWGPGSQFELFHCALH